MYDFPYNLMESPQCVGYSKVVIMQSNPLEVKEVKDDDREKETVHENTDNSDGQT